MSSADLRVQEHSITAKADTVSPCNQYSRFLAAVKCLSKIEYKGENCDLSKNFGSRILPKESNSKQEEKCMFLHKLN